MRVNKGVGSGAHRHNQPTGDTGMALAKQEANDVLMTECGYDGWAGAQRDKHRSVSRNRRSAAAHRLFGVR